MEAPYKNNNLVGIIPVSGRSNSLSLPWPDYLQPLSSDFLAIERSVKECAYAGCKSIWIVCNDDTSPLIRKRLGDYIMDPIIYDSWNFKKFPDYSKEYISIFYIPILQKHRNRIDSLGWATLHGALTAFIVSKKISKWVIPSSYFVSFPYGIYSPVAIKKFRARIRAGKKLYASYGGKTVRDGLYLPFSFTPEDWILFRRQMNELNSGGDSNLPFEERWSAKNFTLDKIFKHDNIDIEENLIMEKYFSLDSWDSLKDFYTSGLNFKGMSKNMRKPYFI